MVWSWLRIPQCPWDVYSQRHTSVAMNRDGNFALSSWIAWITGPCESSAGVPQSSYLLVRVSFRASNHTTLCSWHAFCALRGTPNKITLPRPLSTKGPIKSSSLSTPHLLCPGKVGISTDAVGSSVMKIGYINMLFSSDRRDCHLRDNGWAYPPWRIELSAISVIFYTEQEGNLKIRYQELSDSTILDEGSERTRLACRLLPFETSLAASWMLYALKLGWRSKVVDANSLLNGHFSCRYAILSSSMPSNKFNLNSRW